MRTINFFWRPSMWLQSRKILGSGTASAELHLLKKKQTCAKRTFIPAWPGAASAQDNTIARVRSRRARTMWSLRRSRMPEGRSNAAISGKKKEPATEANRQAPLGRSRGDLFCSKGRRADSRWAASVMAAKMSRRWGMLKRFRSEIGDIRKNKLL